MATNNQLKFYKSASAPVNPSLGAIWFNTTNRTVNVYVGGETIWEKYAGLVDASWAADTRTLSITNAAGTTIEIKDLASASSINTELGKLDTAVKAAQKTADEAATAAGNAQAHSEGVAVALAAEEKLRGEEITRVEGLISAEASRADAAEKANAAAATDAATAAANAQTYAEGVNTALGQEVTRATGVEEGLDSRLQVVEAALGAGEGSVADMMDEKIGTALDALDFNDTKGSTVSVQIVQENGKITTLAVDDSKAATAQSVTDEIDRAQAAEQALGARIDALDSAGDGEGNGKGRVTILEEQVAALNSATHFEGVVDFNPAGDGAIIDGYDPGDIVIYDTKEYIFDGSKWIELGDTTAEQGRISALEGLVGTTSVGAQIDAKIAALSNEAKSSGDDNLVKVTVSQAAGNVTSVSLDDTKLDEAISGINSNIGANTAAHEANAAAIKTINETTIPGINGRLDGLDEDVERIDGVLATLATSDAMTQLTNRVAANEDAISRLDDEQDSQDQAIASADAKGAQGITDAAAALAEAQAKIKSVTGDADVNASTTDHAVALSLNKATSVVEGDTKAVTSGAVYEALCWVEFE